MWIVILLTLIRLCTPLLLFVFPPLHALFFYILGESLDWCIFPMELYDYSGYQQWDKFMDVWFMVIALVFALKNWHEQTAKRILTMLFIYRLVGVLAFEIIAWRPLLLIFPNLFDMFFVFYLVYQLVCKKPLFTSLRKTIFTLLTLLIPKLLQEFFIHFLDRMPWQFDSLSLHLTSVPQINLIATLIIWLCLFLALPYSMLHLLTAKKSGKMHVLGYYLWE